MPRASDCIACSSMDVPGDQLCAIHREAHATTVALAELVHRTAGVVVALAEAQLALSRIMQGRDGDGT